MNMATNQDGLEAAKRFKEAQKQRGVVYLSRIPPHLKPEKIRHEMSQFGQVDRIYLVPEDGATFQFRKKKGGNRKRNFTEGWVEFLDKRIAKAVALSLNNTPMGGTRRAYYREDLWNIKYLSKFTWDALTEKIKTDQALKQQKLAVEVSQSKRETNFYLDRVQQAKKIEKKRKTMASTTSTETKSAPLEIHRQFKQRKAITKQSSQSSKTLSAILPST